MPILSALLFSISANIDNLTVGTAYGIKKVRITFFSNALIAVVSCIGTFLSMTFGKIICCFIPQVVSNILGSLILILLGIWFILSPIIKKSTSDKAVPAKKNDDQYSIVNYEELFNNPEKIDADNSGNIDVKESLTLALALTINNFGLGIGASITGLNMPLTLIFTFSFSIIFIIIGQFIGKFCISDFCSKYANFISGIIIIALGVYNMIF